MQIIINDFQNMGALTNFVDSYFPAYTIILTDPIDGQVIDPVDVSCLYFTPGMPMPIAPDEITWQVSISFVVQSFLGKAPNPQFGINGKLFDYKHITNVAHANTSQSWMLTSSMYY